MANCICTADHRFFCGLSCEKNYEIKLFSFFENFKMVKPHDHDGTKDDSKDNRPITRSHAAIKKPNSRERGKSHANIEKNKPSDANVTRIVLPSNFFGMTPVSRPERPEHQLSRAEERYISALSEGKRRYLLKELKNNSCISRVPLRFRVLQSNIPNKSEILHRIANSCDSPKFETWIESLLSLPLGKICPPPVKDVSQINSFLLNTRNEMDQIVFGQHEAKNEIMRLLCQWSASGGLSSFAIALEGPPGIGKTTFAKNVISRVMKRPFNFISLGGATDASHLMGHSYTYEGAIPGRIVDGLKASNVMNPCFYFDELDKISKTPKGDEISNILIHLTDREQNAQFHDRYFNGIDLDLSQSLFIFSYNNVQNINPILLDRLNVIKFKTPSIDEKIEIAKQHLIPKAIKATGIKINDIEFSDETIRYIIETYTDESGVRNLEKNLCRIISTLGMLIHAPDLMKTTDIQKNDAPIQCKYSVVDEILVDEKKDNNSYMLMYQ